MKTLLRRIHLGKLNRFELVVAVLWIVTLLVICIRVAVHPQRNTVFNVFTAAGANWRHGTNVYIAHDGFLYSPLAAAFFAPFSLLPSAVSNVSWRLLNAAIFLGAVAWWLKAGLSREIGRAQFALVFLLLLPLSIGNFNNGQVNPIIIGLLMVALLAARAERWYLAALCIAVTVYFKIYPLAAGLVLMALFPKKFTWRFLLVLLLLGALSFALQRPGYVLDEYRLWLSTRAADNRRLYQMTIAPRDLWMILRLLHITISERLYTIIQILSGTAVALVCVAGRWRGWPLDRVLAVLLSLVTAWMLLCGPSTESATYILLGPPIALALAQAFAKPFSIPLRTGIAVCYAFMLFALASNSFFHWKKNAYNMSVQPAGALLFVACTAAFVLLYVRGERSSDTPALT